MDDPRLLLDPGDTGEPNVEPTGGRRRTDGGWREGPRRDSEPRPNPHGGADVSVPVMTMSVRSEFVVGFDPDPTSAAETGAAHTAFDDLFRDHYDRLVRSLTVACGDRESAADAVQEAFVKAHVRWRRIGRYDDPVGWVRRVAINQLRDDHRRLSRRQRALARIASSTRTSEQPAEPDEFGRLLAELPRQQRVVTALYYVDGMSVTDIATALGLAEGSVKSHLFDARKRLRAVLDDERGPEHGR